MVIVHNMFLPVSNYLVLIQADNQLFSGEILIKQNIDFDEYVFFKTIMNNVTSINGNKRNSKL